MKLIVGVMSIFEKFISDVISRRQYHTNMRPIRSGYELLSVRIFRKIYT